MVSRKCLLFVTIRIIELVQRSAAQSPAIEHSRQDSFSNMTEAFNELQVNGSVDQDSLDSDSPVLATAGGSGIYIKDTGVEFVEGQHRENRSVLVKPTSPSEEISSIFQYIHRYFTPRWMKPSKKTPVEEKRAEATTPTLQKTGLISVLPQY